MFANTLAVFVAALIVTVASALTFEGKPTVEQFSAPTPTPSPPRLVLSQPATPVVRPPRHAVYSPKLIARVALAPVQVVENTPKPHIAELARGTNLFVQLTEKLSNRENYAGETFRGALDQPVIWRDFIIADRGSKVLGRVVTSGKQHLTLTLTEINTTDGQRVSVTTNVLGNSSRLAFQLADPLTLTEKLNH